MHAAHVYLCTLHTCTCARCTHVPVHTARVHTQSWYSPWVLFQPRVCGNNCDICLQGFYNLQTLNYQGCDPCFCFGISHQCQSSIWGRMKVQPYVLFNVIYLVVLFCEVWQWHVIVWHVIVWQWRDSVTLTCDYSMSLCACHVRPHPNWTVKLI